MSQAVKKNISCAPARILSGELASQLRTAVVDGDDARIARLVAELLRCKGLSRSQRIALQQRALLSLVQSLRSATLSDELTGLHNRRGFAQIGTRLLDFASRDDGAAHLVYFCVAHLERVCETSGHAAGQILVRDCANHLRDLFPNYGVYEVLGRMANDEFAALTTRAEFAVRERVLSRIQSALADRMPSVSLSVGVAHFDPKCASSIDELIEAAKRDMNQASGVVGVDLPVSRLGLTALSAYRV